MEVKISDEQIINVLSENIKEILKDVFTGYNSPVKKLFTDENSQVYKSLKATAEKIFEETIKSKTFQDDLKEKMMQVAIENMLKR